MARGGIRFGPDGKPLGGRPRGQKNLKTLERENAALAEKLRTRAVAKTDLEVMREIRDFWLGAAAREIKKAAKEKRDPDLGIVERAHDLAGAMASKRAPFLHPKLSSVTVRDDPLDLSRCTDDELALLARIRARTAVGRSDQPGDGQTAH